MNQEEKTKRIRELNDEMRWKMQGKWLITSGVQSMESTQRFKLLHEVQTFKTFSEDNDPNREHDFGSIDLNGERYFWKIDYYAKDDMDHGSEDPSDPEQTTRVMTIMRADEY